MGQELKRSMTDSGMHSGKGSHLSSCRFLRLTHPSVSTRTNSARGMAETNLKEKCTLSWPFFLMLQNMRAKDYVLKAVCRGMVHCSGRHMSVQFLCFASKLCRLKSTQAEMTVWLCYSLSEEEFTLKTWFGHGMLFKMPLSETFARHWILSSLLAAGVQLQLWMVSEY